MSKGVIYCAHCLVNGKKYIGQTINYQNRLKRHKSDFKKVDNKFYRAIRKYGWESFIWGIVEEYDVNFLNEKETYWIEKYNSYYFGYNSNFGALTPVDPKRFKKFTIKSPNGEILNISNQSEFCRKYNLDSRALFKLLTGKRKSHKGWTLPETIKIGPKAISDSLSREFCLKSPSGEIVKGKNVYKFCKKQNLHVQSIYSVLSGKKSQYKGWTNPNIILTKKPLGKNYELCNPNGEIVVGKNITKMCEKYNLNLSNISAVLSGIAKSHKGWKLPETELTGIDATIEKRSKEIILVDPEGRHIFAKNISKFCRDHKLSKSEVYKLLNKKIKTYKGWSIP